MTLIYWYSDDRYVFSYCQNSKMIKNDLQVRSKVLTNPDGSPCKRKSREGTTTYLWEFLLKLLQVNTFFWHFFLYNLLSPIYMFPLLWEHLLKLLKLLHILDYFWEILLDIWFHQIWFLLKGPLSFGLVGLWSWHSRAQTPLTEISTGMQLETDPEFVLLQHSSFQLEKVTEKLQRWLVFFLHQHHGLLTSAVKGVTFV